MPRYICNHCLYIVYKPLAKCPECGRYEMLEEAPEEKK